MTQHREATASATDVVIWLAQVLVVVVCVGILVGEVKKITQYVLTCFIHEPKIVIPAGTSPTGELVPGYPATLSTALCRDPAR